MLNKKPCEMTRDEYKKEHKRLYESLGNELYIDSDFNRASSGVSFELHQEALKAHPNNTLNQNYYKIMKQEGLKC